MLNNDNINQRYINNILYLNNIGADIKLVSFAGIMHHKFCIIDEHVCMFGSFNWTHSANIRNIEDLNICDEVRFVYNYLLEFKALWNLSKTDVQLLRNPSYCICCREPIIYILLMELIMPKEYYQTKFSVLKQCSCEQKKVFTDYYDENVYNNYTETVQQFTDDIEAARQSDDEVTYYQLIAQQDFLIANYLSFVRDNRMGMPIIHAVGVKAWKWINKDDGEYFYQIIWKERETSSYIKNEYEFNDPALKCRD